MVHFNTKYGTITDAIDKEDGIAVVAILFQVSFDIAYLTQKVQKLIEIYTVSIRLNLTPG